MPEYLSNNLTAIIIALIGLFVVGIAITITIRISRKRSRDNNSTRVTQSNNKVGGDQAGRDITKR